MLVIFGPNPYCGNGGSCGRKTGRCCNCWLGIRGERGYDAGRKIKGRKRHVLVDTLAVLIAVVITAACVQDRDGAKRVFAEARIETRLEKIWADGGYRGQLLDSTKQEFGWDLEIVKRSDDVSGFEVLPHRWVVERTFGWLCLYRLFCREHKATLASAGADIHAVG